MALSPTKVQIAVTLSDVTGDVVTIAKAEIASTDLADVISQVMQAINT